MATTLPTNTDLKRWPALVGAGLMNIAIGTYYAWSVFVPALEREFGWKRTQTSLVATIDMVSLASMYLLAGFLQKRIGPRVVATIGGVLFSSGLFLTGFIHSLPELYLTAGLMVGIGLGFGYLPPITVGSKWFPDHRGMVNGLAIGIFAAGSGIFGPIAGRMIEQIGWRETFQTLAALFFVFTMVGAYFLKDPPEGYKPPASRSKSKVGHSSQNLDIPTARCCAPAAFTHCGWRTRWAPPLGPWSSASWCRLPGRPDSKTAAFAITIGAIGSATGRFFSGWMSDHFGRLATLRTIVVVSMIATPLLYVWRKDPAAFYVLLFLVYYAYGTQLSVYTALAGDFWGTKYLATNYGVLLLAWGFAGVMGPVLGSRVFVATGTYEYAFFGSALLALGALAILTFVRAPRPVASQKTLTPATVS